MKYTRLIDINSGTYAEIVKINLKDELKERLIELSLIPGENIYVYKNNKSFVIIEYKRGKFGISKEIAEKIVVKKLFEYKK